MCSKNCDFLNSHITLVIINMYLECKNVLLKQITSDICPVQPENVNLFLFL